MTGDPRSPGSTSRLPNPGMPRTGHRADATGPVPTEPPPIASRGLSKPATSPQANPPLSTSAEERQRGPRRSVLVAAVLAVVLVAGVLGGVIGSSLTPSPATATNPPAGAVEAVAQRVLPSVVQLKGGSGEGSGVVLSADGLILTNAHVLQAGQPQQRALGDETPQPPGAANLVALFQNGTSAPVSVVGTDATADLAVVRAENVSDLTPMQIGDSSALQVGQDVVAVGSPLGLSGTVTTGIVSALQRPVASGGAQSGQASVIDAVQTDAAINPGNSGGALVDMQGRLIGITSAIASLSSSSGGGQQSGSIGLGFAIPINQAMRIGDELTRTGSATQAVLGVGVSDARPTGAQLSQLQPGGPAQSAGLAEGEIVVRLNDRVINDANSLVAGVRAQEPGSPVTLTVTSSGGAQRQVSVDLGSERAPSS